MAITPVQQICPADKWNIKCPYTMNPEFIVVHNTANHASAANEITYMNNNSYQVSFHFAVDDKEVRQGIPLNRNAWHAGDGANGNGNRKGIAIEICYSEYDSDIDKFKKAEQLAAKFIAQLLDERGWGTDKVKKHQDFMNKYCPHRTLDMGWTRFVGMVEMELWELKQAKNPPIQWIDQEKKSYIVVNDTNLYDVKTGNKIRVFSAGVGLDFVQHCTYNSKAYYRTQWSKDNNADNGIPVLDVTEVIPENAKVVWEKLSEELKVVALRDCHLVDLHTGEIIKKYDLGEVIDEVCDTTFYNGTFYYRTKTERKAKQDYGFEVYQIEEYQEPTPVTPEDENKGDLERPDEPVIGDTAPTWFVKFITAIAEFIKSFFSKGE